VAGHSRSKNGVASLAYVPAIHAFLVGCCKDVDARDKHGHDGIGRAQYPFERTCIARTRSAGR